MKNTYWGASVLPTAIVWKPKIIGELSDKVLVARGLLTMSHLATLVVCGRNYAGLWKVSCG